MAFTIPAAAQEVEVVDLKTATAQEEELNYGRRIIINRFSDNWEISARIGTQAYIGEYTGDYLKFRDWWTVPAVDISIQKWATHCLGISLGATTSRYKGLRYAYGDEKAQFSKPDDPIYTIDNLDFNMCRGSYGNVYASAVIDLVNAIGGYRKNRIYNLVLSLGGGIMFPTSSVNYNALCASFNAGLNNHFMLTRHLTFDISIRGTINDDMFNGISYYTSDDHKNISVDGTIGVTAGVSYHFNFPKSRKRKEIRSDDDWTPVDSVVRYTNLYREAQGTIASATAAVAASAAALAAAKDRIKELEEALKQRDTVVREIKEDPYPFMALVNFGIDSWKISNREKINILYASEIIKSHPDTKFLISGFADKQTAKPKRNQMLSEKRSEAVYHCLVKEFDVNPDQLSISSYGGVDYMFFDDEQCSRSAIITTYVPNK